MSRNSCSCNVCQSEYNFSNIFRKKHSVPDEQNIQNNRIFQFCNFDPNMIPQPDPYILKDYPADVKHSEISQKDRIKELENALLGRSSSRFVCFDKRHLHEPRDLAWTVGAEKLRWAVFFLLQNGKESNILLCAGCGGIRLPRAKERDLPYHRRGIRKCRPCIWRVLDDGVCSQ